jgi:DeoR/GlpR family transcriptional regulator of sugar metabolism
MLIKKLVISKARVKVMMCGAEKLQRLMPYTFATVSDADFIITDDAMPKEFTAAAKEAGVKVL